MSNFRIGDHVKVIAGHHAGFFGTISEISGPLVFLPEAGNNGLGMYFYTHEIETAISSAPLQTMPKVASVEDTLKTEPIFKEGDYVQITSPGSFLEGRRGIVKWASWSNRAINVEIYGIPGILYQFRCDELKYVDQIAHTADAMRIADLEAQVANDAEHIRVLKHSADDFKAKMRVAEESSKASMSISAALSSTCMELRAQLAEAKAQVRDAKEATIKLEEATADLLRLDAENALLKAQLDGEAPATWQHVSDWYGLGHSVGQTQGATSGTTLWFEVFKYFRERQYDEVADWYHVGFAAGYDYRNSLTGTTEFAADWYGLGYQNGRVDATATDIDPDSYALGYSNGWQDRDQCRCVPRT